MAINSHQEAREVEARKKRSRADAAASSGQVINFPLACETRLFYSENVLFVYSEKQASKDRQTRARWGGRSEGPAGAGESGYGREWGKAEALNSLP